MSIVESDDKPFIKTRIRLKKDKYVQISFLEINNEYGLEIENGSSLNCYYFECDESKKLFKEFIEKVIKFI